ncbi:hypothetical protein [Clostridium perfringens]|uniref:hypothetical protein n=1 Tax=Clostridium perfringens TaxID=1502 RepID=UPI00232C3B0A|nr:hypothetical protein [Clostridium perfringens]MDB2050201.1 hypothetical protein [Clostridium perfringens]
MEKIKKEIRLTYFLDNEEDKRIYEELKKHKQPGKVAKELIVKGLDEKQNKSNDLNLETLKLIEKLTDKIDNLKISAIAVANEENPTVVDEISLDADVSEDDIDIEF